MMPSFGLLSRQVLLMAAGAFCAAAQTTWQFAVSGDSRNCGDVVMPAIAKAVHADGAAFYWHLGDFRAIYRFDQDYWQLKQTPDPRAINIAAYLDGSWRDFIDNQIKPFEPLPFYLAIGNHELIPPKTRDQYIAQFSDWLNTPTLREQRLKDDPNDYVLHIYNHWTKDGLDFITLDNGSPEQFDAAQMKWLQSVLHRDEVNDSVRAVVVGMHEALPQSISADHSMDQSPQGEQSGQQVYQWLLKLKQKKPVYVLASHSHFYMNGIFNTEFWRTHGGVLPGWIIGTAGAERYSLPPHASDAKEAKAHVYGYLLATVTQDRDDPIQFAFKQLQESDVPVRVVGKYTQALVHDCWVNNPPVDEVRRP